MHTFALAPALFDRRYVTSAAFALAALVLAIDPVVWLVKTWRDPSFDSNGSVVALLVLALAAWSISSPVTAVHERRQCQAVGLLLLSAVVRFAGQVLAINFLGALTLVLDVYAIGVLLRLDQRRHAISPAWLAITFAFSLPLERIVQRCIGYALQQVSADGACSALRLIYDRVTCEGIRIVVEGKDVLVDLPCSGARTALLSLLALAVAACFARPTLRQSAAGLLIVVATAFVANVVRISTLAIGIATPAAVGGVDVMAQPWHDAIGLASQSLVIVALLTWTLRLPAAVAAPAAEQISDNQARHWLILERAQLPLAIAALFAAALIVNQPRRAADVAERNIEINLPSWISGEPAESIALTAQEAEYFTQFGGAAVKASYGVHNLMLVRTSSPLRHLHAPDDCLRGLGYNVSYKGMTFDPIPTAVYLATSPSGNRVRIDISFISNRGHAVSNVAAAVWHWLRGEAAVWTAIQRISPTDIPLTRHDQWSAAALTALGVSRRAPDAIPNPVLANGDVQ